MHSTLALGPLLPAVLSAALLGAAASQESGPADPAADRLAAAFEEQGIHFDAEAGLCAVPAEVCIREDLLEYLVVADFGASHESLFSTSVTPSVWNAALVALGAEPAQGGRYRDKDPLPSDEELAAGVSPYEVELPQGTPFYLYALWREEGGVRLHRVEDLVGNLRTGRSMQRHALRYVGSRMVQPDPESDEEVFLADMEGNLVNVFYFQTDKTLLSTALEDGAYDTIWLPNTWLVPERGTPVRLVASRRPLERLPESLEALLPE